MMEAPEAPPTATPPPRTEVPATTNAMPPADHLQPLDCGGCAPPAIAELEEAITRALQFENGGLLGALVEWPARPPIANPPGPSPIAHFINRLVAGSIDLNEPVFILRAKDVLAPGAIEYWASTLCARGGSVEKCNGAMAIAAAMRAWQAQNGSKLPD
jgi:hypothetical protein